MTAIGHFMKGQVSTIGISLWYITRPRTRVMSQRRILMLKRGMLLSIHFEIISNIHLLDNLWGIFVGLGDLI